MNQNRSPQAQQQQKIRRIDVHFRNTRTSRSTLCKITNSLHRSDVMVELFKRVIRTQQVLDKFDSFKSHTVSTYRGVTDADVRVLYRFDDASIFFRQFRSYFDRSGGAMLQFKCGSRNYFGRLERLSLEYTQAMLKWRTYTLNFSYTLPYVTELAHGYKLSYYIQKRDIEKEVSERARTLQLILFHRDPDLSRALIFEDQARDNSVNVYSRHNSTDRYLKYEDYLPTRKRCLRANWTLFDNVQFQRYTHMGTALKGSAEVTLPTSDVQFFKTELTFRHYFQLGKLISPHYFRYVNIDWAASTGIAKSLFGQNLQVNDCFGFKKPRGFEYLDIFIDEMCMIRRNKSFIKSLFEQVDFYAMTSFRFNVYNHPLFQYQLSNYIKDPDFTIKNLLDLRRVSAFYHVSFGYFYRARHGTGIYLSNIKEHLLNHMRVSAGVGISRDISNDLRLEILYNFYHYGQPKDHTLTWQIRLAN